MSDRTDELLLESVIIAALVAPVFRYAVAFQQVEPPLQAGPWSLNVSLITGLGVGVSYELAAYLGIKEAAAARKRGNGRWWWPLGAALLQVALGVFMITPVFHAQLHSVPLSSILSGLVSWLWCALVVAATVRAVKPKPRKAATPSAATNGKQRFLCPWCGEPYGTQNALNAHSGRCSARKREAEQEEQDVSARE